MIATYTFNSSKKRDDFINIIKELWFKYTTNTYSKVIWSKSEVNPQILGNWSNVKTVNNTVTYYEITVDKDLNDDEEKKLNKLVELFQYKERDVSLWLLIFWSLILGSLLALLIGYVFDDFLWLIDFNQHKWLTNITIIWSIWFVFYKFLAHTGNKTSEDKVKINELKNYLIDNYLWENWKKIISNF